MSPKDTYEGFSDVIDLTGVYGVFSGNPEDPAYYYSGDPEAYLYEPPEILRVLREEIQAGKKTIPEAKMICNVS